MQPFALTGLSILVVDDEVLLRKQIVAFLEHQGADVTSAANLAAARQFSKELSFDFALLDVNLPDGLGTDLLKDGVFPGNTGVIVMTANGGVNGAVEAMRLGALDYLSKPFEVAELPLVMARTQRKRQDSRAEEFRREDDAKEAFFFGSSLASLENQLQKILGADRRIQGPLAPVLIQGETGTGKTTIARWLHRQGPRSSQALIEVNCSALPETLAESELFGHERGAFTDARSARMGLFEAANEGTLFLDELPSLSLAVQAKILTVIEDGKIRRVGGNKPIPTDVRLIAATNRDLKQAVTDGRFREDLYHRLDLFRIAIPPLRERGHDILRLAEKYVERLCRRHRMPVKAISKTGGGRLLEWRWPGNVRELAHEIERALVFEDGNELHFEHLCQPGSSAPSGAPNLAEWLNPHFVFPEQGFDLEQAINRLVRRALEQTGGNMSAAARLLGVTRDYIRYRLNPTKAGPGPGGE